MLAKRSKEEKNDEMMKILNAGAVEQVHYTNEMEDFVEDYEDQENCL